MFSNKEWTSLIKTLLSKTQSGTLKWSDPKSSQRYQVTIDADTIVVIKSVDGDGQLPYGLAVFRRGIKDGEEKFIKFADVVSTDLVDEEFGQELGDLDQLFGLVERQINGVDTVFSSIMKSLSEAGDASQTEPPF